MCESCLSAHIVSPEDGPEMTCDTCGLPRKISDEQRVESENFRTQLSLAKPARAMEGREGARMIFTALYEPFLAQIKVAFFTALFLAFPVISMQMWMFIAPGLYRDEKKAFLPFLLATPVLFFLGGALVYYFIMPLAWEFFLNFQTVGGEGTLPVQVEPKVDQYLSLVLRLIFAFGLAF